MGSGAAVLLIFLHIPLRTVSSEPERLKYRNPGIPSENELIRPLVASNAMKFAEIHNHSGTDPREGLVRAEFAFMSNMGFRLELLMDAYRSLIKDENLKGVVAQLLERIEPLVVEFVEIIRGSMETLHEEIKKIYAKYDEKDFIIKPREPRSFVNIEGIKHSFKFVKEVYDYVVEAIEEAEMEEGHRKSLLWTLKQKTVLSSLSAEIMFLHMIYNYGYFRNLKMSFISPGIYYLMLFEAGISRNIVKEKVEGDLEFFNKFLENYEASVEELVQRTIFHIQEDEIPMDENERAHRDIEIMHKDFREVIKPLITLNGAAMRKVEL